MDIVGTVYVPDFLKDQSDMQILRRVEVFTNQSIMFTNKMNFGDDTSVETIKAVLDYPPLEGLTVMNGVLDLLKDAVFAYQATKLTENGSNECPHDPALQQRKNVQYEIFLRGLMPFITRLQTTLATVIEQHKSVIKKIRNATLDFAHQYNDLQLITQQFKSAQVKRTETSLGATQDSQAETSHQPTQVKQFEGTHTLTQENEAETVHGTTQGKQSETTEKTDQISIQIQMDKLNRTGIKSLYRVLMYFLLERQMREGKLKETENKLRRLIQRRIADTLKEGHTHLVEFGKQFALSETIMTRLDQFDVHHVASQIYRQMSTRYCFPKVECFGSEKIRRMPECRFESPDLTVQNNDDIRLGKSGSCMDLIHESLYERRRMELYVRACNSFSHKNAVHFLSLSKGQKVKQKLCSSDGSLAFGWKRLVPGGRKTYGFYPTHSVNLVP